MTLVLCENLEINKKKHAHNFKNLTGQKFGELTILFIDERINKYKRIYWKCRCECGNICSVASCQLISGKTKSCGCLRRLDEGIACFNRLFDIYQRSAKRRGFKFNLTKKEFKELTKNNCYYCEIIPSQKVSKNKANGNYIYNGIDRIDSTKDYEISNCCSCCKNCNFMKLNLSINDFLIHIKKIYNYRIKNENSNC